MDRTTEEPDFAEPRSRPWIWIVYVLLFGASVPWYLPAGPARLWFGLPHWVVISLGASLGVAVFTAFVIARYWSAPDAGDPLDIPPDPANDGAGPEEDSRH